MREVIQMDIKIDFDSHIPLYQQVIDNIIALIASGRLRVGDELPSIRNLASQLSVNPATIVRTYRYLENMGVLKTRKGKKSKIVGLPMGVKGEQLVELYRDFLTEVRKMGYTEKEVLDTVSKHSLNAILALDVGSTTTKAILFKRNNKGKMAFSGFNQSKTTVETIEEDVWVGVVDSIKGLEDKTNWKLLKNDELIIPSAVDSGVDLFVATSSAGGGLQMVTVGLVTFFTSESAERTALGAGAIVTDVFAIDDERTPFEKIMALKELRPDIILLSGGVEGGAISLVAELGEILAASEIKGKFGDYKIPLVYAGNSNGREFIEIALKDRFDLSITENIRPTLNEENLSPARREIMRIFMEHVMKRAPGYEQLVSRVSIPVLPTPGAIFELLKRYSEHNKRHILAFDIGGATTDVFSAYDETVVRTVSANIGMSYSLLQTIERAGLKNVMKWMPLEINEGDLQNLAANKMISPTSLPSNKLEIEMEMSVAKEIFQAAFIDHKKLAEKELIDDTITIERLFKGEDKKPKESTTGRSELNLLMIDMIIGTGGILSHLKRNNALEIMLDGFEAKGITEFYADSEFMMPHLGVLSSVNPALGLELFENECLIPLATVISPLGKNRLGRVAFSLNIDDDERKVKVGDFIRIPLDKDTVEVKVLPSKRFDAGKGKGIPVRKIVKCGQFGIICDMRIRPLNPTPERIMEWRTIISGENNG
ncbi:glutamate mutase L [candidate division WOR-3 bacterium]|nr:glutamate mutase L [candidate division WOR-3 bacterium]